MEDATAPAKDDVLKTPEITIEDAWKAIEIVKRALKLRDYIKEGIFGPRWLELSKEQRMEEFLNPRISIFYPDEDRLIPGIYLRITSEEGPLVEAFFYPVEAAWSFLQEARETLGRHRPINWTDEEFEANAQTDAVEMMLLMIDNLYGRFALRNAIPNTA